MSVRATYWRAASLLTLSVAFVVVRPYGVGAAAGPLALTPSPEPPTPAPPTATTAPAATHTPAPTATSIPSTPTAPPPTATTAPVAPSPTPTSVPPSPTPTRRRAPRPTNTPPPTAVPETPTAGPWLVFADPAITQAANITEAQVGDVVDFTLTVSNEGALEATDVVVMDVLPGFIKLVNAGATRGQSVTENNTVTVKIGTVVPGEVITIRVTGRMIAAASAPNNRNTATLSTSSPTDNPANNSDSVSITVRNPSARPSPTPSARQPGAQPSPTASVRKPNAKPSPTTSAAVVPTRGAGAGAIAPRRPEPARPAPPATAPARRPTAGARPVTGGAGDAQTGGGPIMLLPPTGARELDLPPRLLPALLAGLGALAAGFLIRRRLMQ